MSFGDIFKVVSDGGPDVIFLLLVFIGLVLTDRVFVKREITQRDEALSRSLAVNEKLTETNDRQQDLFEQALGLLRKTK